MRIAIVGAGFTGLSAAYQLLKNGHDVSIFEKESEPGGLALGFKVKGWQWPLEQHYHHWFTKDKFITDFAKTLGFKLINKRPKTSVYVNSSIYQLDSPAGVLKFPELSFLDRARMGLVLSVLRFNPVWKPLEKFRAVDILPKTMGEKAYSLLWKPLLEAKFQSYMDDISLAWFWARINKRTSSLFYPEGGFLVFAQFIANEIVELGGKIHYDHEILEIKQYNNVQIVNKNKAKVKKDNFDKVIVTLPSPSFIKIASQLPIYYREELMKLKGLGAINLILRLKEKFFKDNTYWLSICDKEPVLAIVEHTNYMDKKFYNNEHLLYLGNYLPLEHSYFQKSPLELLNIYDSLLKKINKNYKNNLIGYNLFRSNFAQPVIPLNYSKIIPPFKTPLKDVFLANIQQVYPWDRGTNYALELGQKVVEKLLKTN